MMRTKFELFAAVLLLLSASNLFAQTTYTWALNNASGNWDANPNWGALPGQFPGVNDTAILTDFAGIQPPIAAILANISNTSPQPIRNVTFSNSNTVTAFTIGPAGTVLNVGSAGPTSTILRAGSANATIASNIAMGNNLLVNNTNNTVVGRSLTLTTVSTGAGNTINFSGAGTTNVTTINGGGNASFSSTGTVNVANLSTLNSVSFNGGTTNVTTGITNVSTITATGGTNTIASVSGSSTVDLNGGTNSIGSVTGGVVNVNGGNNSLSNATGTQVVLTGNLGSNLALGGAGATLRGTGTVNGNLTINAGADYSPGVGATTGSQIINGDLTFNGGSIFTWHLNGNTTNSANYDQVNLSGNDLFINGSVNTNLSFTGVSFTNAFWTSNQTWQVFSNVATNSLLTNFNIIGGGAAPGTFSWVRSGSNINLQFLTSVPEPSSLALVVFLGGVLGFSRRRMAR